jgi:translocator assembly and maintenance protein 41
MIKIEIKNMANNLSLFTNIFNIFPQKHIKFAFAYGSGVFKQINNHDVSNNLIDFVFVVDDSIKFHHDNIKINSSHYSFLKYLGPYYISRIQNNLGASCYYNTLIQVKIDEKVYMIKYGIISDKSLIKDLYDWKWLYMSGRLHKPVKVIKKPNIIECLTNEDKFKSEANNQFYKKNEQLDNINDCNFDSVNKSIDLALQTNLRNALHTSLLLLPEKFTLTDLFMCITSLSYSGDLRMLIGEDKKKVFNIVLPQIDRFLKLYKPYIVKECKENFLDCDFNTGKLEQNLNQTTLYRHFNFLPKNLMQTIINLKYKTNHCFDMEEYIYNLTNRADYKDLVFESLSSIVRYSSTMQSFKGIFTAGLFKTFNYSARKLKKMLK